MQKIYELWLDESGKFVEEAALKSENMKPSLIGGILLEKHIAETVDFEGLLSEKDNHAMHFSDTQKRDYVLPILERLKEEYGAVQVFFENTEYEDEDSGRQLYLRMMAEGLIQLLQTLDATTESVVLEVLIAQRQDVYAPNDNRRIAELEYIEALKQCIRQKKKEHRVLVDDRTELRFEVRPAHKTQKLQFADFACNTRLTRDSMAFETVRDRVQALYDNAYLIALNEVSSVHFITRSLNKGYLADAVKELYSTGDALDHQSALGLVRKALQSMSLRKRRSQLRQCVSELTEYVEFQDDLRIAECFLKGYYDEFIPVLKELEIPCGNLELQVLSCLMDVYLREGNVIGARRILEACEQVQKELSDRMEQVPAYLRLRRREAILCLEEYDFECAYRLTEDMLRCLERRAEWLQADPYLGEQFTDVKSEKYPELLCLQAMALAGPGTEWAQDRYAKAMELLEQAQNYLPEETTGKYLLCSSKIALAAGHSEEALRYLGKAKGCDWEAISVSGLHEMLKKIPETENEAGQKEYMLAYLSVLADESTPEELSDVLWTALQEQPDLLYLCGIRKADKRNESLIEIDMEEAREEQTGTVYSPMDLLWWNYGRYLAGRGNYRSALRYLERGADICFRAPECSKMLFRGVQIMQDIISCMEKGKSKPQELEVAKAKKKMYYDRLMSQALSESMRRYIRSVL